ncbi:Fe-S cluster assembly ATPase SufC [Candidatus Woesearchaeota archaeon]|nr:Fe-S cluster assembly ATPase SufC [Candidatus Woesearchaeota archaeon]
MKLEIKDLHVAVEGKEILHGVDLDIGMGTTHCLMGPNGSGKSTLAHALMGHPKYVITEGKILLDGEDITSLPPHERAKRGLFLSFQYPAEIPGVTLSNFLRTALNNLGSEKLGVLDFHKLLKEKMGQLDMDSAFTKRYLNEGFSGGEKKRAEILQLLVLQPKFAVLDETDSGLDIDALKVVAQGVNSLQKEHRGILLITHYNRILHYIVPDRVHVMYQGKIIKSGGKELANEIEQRGYAFLQEVAA